LSFEMRIGVSSVIIIILYKLLAVTFTQKPNQQRFSPPEENANAEQEKQHLKAMTREMKKQIYDLHNLFEISMHLTSILNYDQLINAYLLSLIGQLQTTKAIIFFPTDEEQQTLQPAYSKGIPIEKFNDIKIPFDDSFIRNFQQQAMPLDLEIADNNHHDNLHSLKEAGLALIAPIIHKNKITGVVAIGGKINSEVYRQSEKEKLSLMTNIASVGISNARLYQQMELISVTDELTNLYNYRFFKKQLDDELARARRFKHYLSLVILDVDFFKNYNDSLGHAAGDEALRAMGKLLKTTARQGDIVSRYGGEEFCAILPEVDLVGAWHFSERLRKKVEEHHFNGREVQPSGKLTISLGAACYPNDARKGDELLKKADAALYSAKSNGKNQVCLYSKMVTNHRTFLKEFD